MPVRLRVVSHHHHAKPEQGEPWGSQTAVPSLYRLSHVTSAAWVCSRMSVMCVQVRNMYVCGGQRSTFSLLRQESCTLGSLIGRELTDLTGQQALGIYRPLTVHC